MPLQQTLIVCPKCGQTTWLVGAQNPGRCAPCQDKLAARVAAIAELVVSRKLTLPTPSRWLFG